jgi:uncharacterized MnhB-related membrane protein
MIAVALLTLGQFAAALLSITVFLLIAQQIGIVFYQDAGIVTLVFMMTAFAVIGALWGVFVRPWWLYLIASSLLAGLLFALTFWLIDAFVAGTQAKIGAAGTAFLFPMLAFIVAYPLGGIAQWLIGLAKR